MEKEEKIQVATRLTKSELEALDKCCKEQYATRAWILRAALRQYLKQQED